MRNRWLTVGGGALAIVGGALWFYSSSVVSYAASPQVQAMAALNGDAASRVAMWSNLVPVGLIAAVIGVVTLVIGLVLTEMDPSTKFAMRPCSECGERILADAKVCRFCNNAVTPLIEGAGAGGTDVDLRQLIVNQKIELADMSPDEMPATRVFELGRKYATLFDRTNDARHRAAALKYMRRGTEIDANVLCGGEGFFLQEFGSLESDPEFAKLLREPLSRRG